MSQLSRASLAAVGLLLATQASFALDNGLARTPPMGWASWNSVQWRISETFIKGNADALAASGLADLGYKYVLVDLGWQAYAAGAMRARNADSTIRWDTGKFPSGMASLAGYIRGKGLKYGAYTDCGYETCGNMTEGSRDLEYKDMATFAAWGADYVKVDYCGIAGRDARTVYTLFRDAIVASGRPMVYAVCNWGLASVQQWGPSVANLWRISGDIDTTFASLMAIVDKAASSTWYPSQKPGAWNDLDMLEVGNGHFTPDENKAHFSLWCVFASPLMLGNDLRSMTPEIRDIVGNTEVIAVDQDILGQMGRRMRDDGNREVYVKHLADSGRAVVLLNRDTVAARFAVNWSELGLAGTEQALVRDLWQHVDRGMYAGSYSADVPAHGVVMVKVTPAAMVSVRSAALRAARVAGHGRVGTAMLDVQGRLVARSSPTVSGGVYVVRGAAGCGQLRVMR